MQFLVDMVIKMKQQAIFKPFFSQAEITAAMEAATLALAGSDNPETQPDDWQNAIVILNHNQPAFYCIPAEAYQQLLDRLEDAELNHIADQRQGQAVIKVSIDEL